MTDRVFRIQISAGYDGPENTIAEYAAQCEEDGQWREFVLAPDEPGFVIFVYAIANCQHLHLRIGATERGLALEEAEGLVEVVTDGDWKMKALHIRFEGRLRSGRASARDIDAIIERMGNCPVSMNLADIRDTRISLRLD